MDGARRPERGALVDEAARGGGGPAPYGPNPVRGVDVPDAAAGNLADAGGGTRGEEDDIAPAPVLIVGGGYERVSQLNQRLPVGQGQRTRDEELVLGLLVELLPPVTRAGLILMTPSRTACSMTRTRTARVFLTVERLCSSAIQFWTVWSTTPLVMIRTGGCPRTVARDVIPSEVPPRARCVTAGAGSAEVRRRAAERSPVQQGDGRASGVGHHRLKACALVDIGRGDPGEEGQSVRIRRDVLLETPVRPGPRGQARSVIPFLCADVSGF